MRPGPCHFWAHSFPSKGKAIIHSVCFDFLSWKLALFNGHRTWELNFIYCPFLEQANRALRQATLGTLNSLVVTYGGQIGSSSYETIIAELSTLIRFFFSFTILDLSCICCLPWQLILTYLLLQWHGFAYDCSCTGTLLHNNGRQKIYSKCWFSCEI